MTKVWDKRRKLKQMQMCFSANFPIRRRTSDKRQNLITTIVKKNAPLNLEILPL